MLPFPRLNQYGNIAPVPTITIQDFKSTPSGDSTTLRYSNYELYALGTNTNGKFGTGSTTALSAWTRIATNVKTYCVDAASSYIVKNDGTIWASGAIGIYNGANLNGSSTGWNVTTPTTVYVDMTYTYPTLMKTRGIKQIESSSSPLRQWVVDSTGVLWGLGSQASYTLGTNVAAPNTDWIQITTNVDRVFSTQQSVWIIKNDKTIWRSGINTSGQIAGTNTTDIVQGFTELNIYSPLTYLDMNILGNAAIQLLLSDGSMRFYGTASWINSSAVQLQPGYTPTITGTPATIKMNNSGGTNPNYFARTADNIWAEGGNTSGALGIGMTSNAYNGTWYTALTGVLNDPATVPTLSSITNMSSVTIAGFLTTQNEVYVSGRAAYSLNNDTSGFWQVQRTPKSQVYAAVDTNPLLNGVATNLSTSTTNPPVLAARFGHATAVWGKKLLVHGGVVSTTAFADSGQINIYDTETNTWSTIANGTATSRYAHSMCVVGNLAYIWGGYTAVNAGGITNTMYSINLNTGVWTNLAPSNNISSGEYSRMVSTSNGMVYMWGRSSGNALYQYNPSTNAWTTLPISTILPHGSTTNVQLNNTSSAGFCSDGTYLYPCTGVVQIAKFDPVSNSWRQLQSKPTAQGKCSFLNGVLYCMISNNLYAYRVSTGVWTTIANSVMTTQRAIASMEAVNGALYYVGGQSSTSTDCFYRIN